VRTDPRHTRLCAVAAASLWLLLGAAPGAAQPAPGLPVPAPGTAEPGAREKALAEARRLLPAQSGETVIIPVLRGIVLVRDAQEARSGAGGGAGFDFSRVAPAVAGLHELDEVARYFLGKPASLPSLERIVVAIQGYLQATGRRFVLVYLPPQDLADGSVRIVVQPARLDGSPAVQGVTHFSAGQYEGLLGRAGETIDDGRIEEVLDRLNRNPFRRATVVAEPGGQPGTTRLALRLQERPPYDISLGADNTGSPNTGKNRVFAGLSWGDAFGRGDQAGYQFKADPESGRMVSHALTYTAETGRGTVSVNGAWSRLKPDLGPLFGQVGHSWQLSGRYALPAPAPAGWSAQGSLGADYKHSDNTIEFAAVPVVNNDTRIAQLVAGYALRGRGQASHTDVSLQAVLSPGGIGRNNDDAAFDGSRAGARARYAYARVDATHRHGLGAGGWSARWAGSVQVASGPLLGSEQLGGGGTAAVRAFRESAAFGDSGVVASVEVHTPAWQPAAGHVLDPYVFADAARLLQGGGGVHSTLAGAGAGLDYAFSSRVSLRSSVAWVLRRPPGSTESPRRINVSMRLSF
jgi:hemolysin activation/secretion protein